MKNEEKPIGRGKFAVMAWEEAKKAGGLSYSPEQIQAILQGGNEDMLTREEVQQRISAYLQSCITLSQDEESGEFNYVWKRNPTKAALALALGIDAGTLCDYIRGKDRHGNRYKQEGENKGVQKIATADFDLLRKAYSIVEDFYESKLADNRNNGGVIFWLLNKENKRWSNEQEFRFGAVEEPERKVLSADELPKFFLKDWESKDKTIPELLEESKKEKENEVKTMTYVEWKVLEASKETKDMQLVIRFERDNPATAREYAKRKQEERKKIEDIMKIQDRDTRLRKLAKATYDPNFAARRRREQM